MPLGPVVMPSGIGFFGGAGVGVVAGAGGFVGAFVVALVVVVVVLGGVLLTVVLFLTTGLAGAGFEAVGATGGAAATATAFALGPRFRAMTPLSTVVPPPLIAWKNSESPSTSTIMKLRSVANPTSVMVPGRVSLTRSLAAPPAVK